MPWKRGLTTEESERELEETPPQLAALYSLTDILSSKLIPNPQLRYSWCLDVEQILSKLPDEDIKALLELINN